MTDIKIKTPIGSIPNSKKHLSTSFFSRDNYCLFMAKTGRRKKSTLFKITFTTCTTGWVHILLFAISL